MADGGGRHSIRKSTNSETEEAFNAATMELDEEELDAFRKATEGDDEAQSNTAANAGAADVPPPESAYYIVKKKPRGRTFGDFNFTGPQDRILVLHKGNLRYYKATDDIVKQPPFVLVEPQGEMENGVKGCSASIAMSDKEARTLSINVKTRGDAKGLEVIFAGSGDLRTFLTLFDQHVEYYKTRPIPKLSNKGANEI
jgi:hypothetical protein